MHLTYLSCRQTSCRIAGTDRKYVKLKLEKAQMGIMKIVLLEQTKGSCENRRKGCDRKERESQRSEEDKKKRVTGGADGRELLIPAHAFQGGYQREFSCLGLMGAPKRSVQETESRD